MKQLEKLGVSPGAKRSMDAQGGSDSRISRLLYFRRFLKTNHFSCYLIMSMTSNEDREGDKFSDIRVRSEQPQQNCY